MLRGAAWVTGLLVAITIGTGAAHGAVVVNEVNCEGTDWVELVNTGDDPVDLSGWLLTDDPLDADRADHRLLIAGGTTIPQQGAIVFEKGAAGFPFGVKCGEDTIRLADARGHAGRRGRRARTRGGRRHLGPLPERHRELARDAPEPGHAERAV